MRIGGATAFGYFIHPCKFQVGVKNLDIFKATHLTPTIHHTNSDKTATFQQRLHSVQQYLTFVKNSNSYVINSCTNLLNT